MKKIALATMLSAAMMITGVTPAVAESTLEDQVTFKDAVEIALKDAGLQKDSVTFNKKMRSYEDGTPVYDIKPYIPYTDAHPGAAGGFASEPDSTLEVAFPEAYLRQIPEKKRSALLQVLAQDPRPSYRADGERVYGLYFAGFNVRFRVENAVLTVVGVEKI